MPEKLVEWKWRLLLHSQTKRGCVKRFKVLGIKLLIVIRKWVTWEGWLRGSDPYTLQVELAKASEMKIFERMEATALLHTLVCRGKVSVTRKTTKSDVLISREFRKSDWTIHLQWRVWSWLRMNASGRLNTCKSRGSTGSNTGWRPANGCGTRTQLTLEWGIAQGNLD